MAASQTLILAVPSDGLSGHAERSAFIPLPEDRLWSILIQAGLWLGPRHQLEEIQSFRQLIPYVALKYGEKFVKYTRTPASGESRLHGRVSIGLGGHIDLSDIVVDRDNIDLVKTLNEAAHREVNEELNGVEVLRKRWIGLLVDNENAVGRVHLGVVAVWDLRSMPSGSGEAAIGETGLVALSELQREEARMETWSTILVRHWLASSGVDP